jgi:glucosamine-phosphate N-acetyltransferase
MEGNRLNIEHLENGLNDEELLFDPLLLKSIDWSLHRAKFHGDISPSHPGDHLVMRPLSIVDCNRGFVQLLSQLTDIGDLCKDKFIQRFRSMKVCPGTYYTVVIEDKRNDQIVGSATLVVEQKFIHAAAIRGRVEDVVVSEICRGKQLGKLLVETLILLGRHLGVYKISLECKDDNTKFYESLGFAVDVQHYMVQRF